MVDFARNVFAPSDPFIVRPERHSTSATKSNVFAWKVCRKAWCPVLWHGLQQKEFRTWKTTIANVAACLAHAVHSTYVMIACAIIPPNTRDSSFIPLRISWGERHASEASTGRSTSEHYVRRVDRVRKTRSYSRVLFCVHLIGRRRNVVRFDYASSG